MFVFRIYDQARVPLNRPMHDSIKLPYEKLEYNLNLYTIYKIKTKICNGTFNKTKLYFLFYISNFLTKKERTKNIALPYSL